MSIELGRTVFILVALAVLGWFALGTQLNVRRGDRVLRWLQDGMTLLGPKTTLRWLGSSGIELKVENARAPLRSATVFVVLEPRDLPVVWWLFHILGRRDLLVVRGELLVAPRSELEALDPRSWSAGRVERTLQGGEWTRVALPGGSPPALVAYTRGLEDGTAVGMLPLALLPGAALVRLAVRHGAPHLELQWNLAGLEAIESRRVVQVLHRLAERA
jgi:hypothetical protein